MQRPETEKDESPKVCPDQAPPIKTLREMPLVGMSQFVYD
jgi:hypothetical protein